MKILILRKAPDGCEDMLLGMVTNNVRDELIEKAVSDALLDLAARYASEIESTDGEGSR